jgi:Cu+-exporting ATPase
LAGERIPVDGTVRQGVASVDQSLLTGESLPAERVPGDTVRAGSLCLDGTLELVCLAASEDSLLSRMVRAVEEARAEPSRMERLADRAAAAFVPLTMALAALVTVYWQSAGPGRAWLIGLSVLVVACPCAMGIAAPLVNVLALAAAARRGVLVRSAEALERLAGVSMVAFDKTGTLTLGRIEVQQVVPASPESELLASAAAAGSASLHPVAQAVARATAAVAPTPQQGARTLPGRGVEVQLEDGGLVLLGQPRWVESQVAAVPEDWRRALDEAARPGQGVVWCARYGRLLGAFVFEDPPDQEAAEAVAACRKLGLRLMLLSGDRTAAVEEAARRLGIADHAGELLPEDKVARIRARQEQGQHVAMVGDGLNDALALAAADVGIAVSSGADVTREVAEVAFLEGGLRKLPRLIVLARRARRIAIQNLAWAFGYNSVMLALASAGMLRPIWAALIMLASSAVVILNALRVRK